MQNKWNPALGKTIGMPIATVPQDPGLQLMTLCNTSHVTSTGWHLSPSATKVMESHDERLLLQANIGRIGRVRRRCASSQIPRLRKLILEQPLQKCIDFYGTP